MSCGFGFGLCGLRRSGDRVLKTIKLLCHNPDFCLQGKTFKKPEC